MTYSYVLTTGTYIAMDHTQINHSPLITAIENFVEDTLTCQRPWDRYWFDLVDLLQELQVQYNPNLVYSAYNQAMIKLMLKLEQDLTAFQDIEDLTVKHLRFQDVKSSFKKFERQNEKEVQQFKEDELKNRGKALEYTELLLEHYSKLSVIRIDLSYKSEKRTFIDITEFREDIRKLLDRLQDRDRHFKDLQGYIYALEQGALKGYHVHFLLFYDGSRVKFDRHIADCIIDTWKEITNEVGIGYNSNTRENRKRYKATGNDALGRVKRGNQDKKTSLLKIVRYFTEPTKTEQYLRVRVKNMQSFGHGKFRKPSRRTVADTIERVRLNMRFEGGLRHPRR